MYRASLVIYKALYLNAVPLLFIRFGSGFLGTDQASGRDLCIVYAEFAQDICLFLVHLGV